MLYIINSFPNVTKYFKNSQEAVFHIFGLLFMKEIVLSVSLERKHEGIDKYFNFIKKGLFLSSW